MSLEDKLKKLKDEKKEVQIDWAKKKGDWIQSVSRLYDQIQEWLGDLIGQGYVGSIREGIAVTEQSIGPYQIEKLEIQFGGRRAIFEPVGTNIIGGNGRIDLFLSGAKALGYMLILVQGAENNDEWYLVDRKKRQEKKLLTKEIIEGLMEEWLD